MKIAVIYGTLRKSSTYNVAKQFIDKLSDNDEVSEFFLPKDAPNFCRGCFQCFEDCTKCPDYEYIKPILDSMISSELIIFTSPVYVCHVTGQMKAFLDHFGFQWMAHQPNEAMFSKQALIISTTAGIGTKSTIKDIRDSLVFWGIARIYGYGKRVAAANWDNVSDKIKSEIQVEVNKLAKKIKRNNGKVKPSLKVKVLFYAMRFMQIKFGFNPPDVAHWRAHGWLGNKRPW